MRSARRGRQDSVRVLARPEAAAVAPPRARAALQAGPELGRDTGARLEGAVRMQDQHSAPGSLILANVEVEGRCAMSVRVEAGRVAAIGPSAEVQKLGSADLIVDGRGGAVLSGLRDHHLHLLSMAARRTSVPCGPPAVTTVEGSASRPAGGCAGGWKWAMGPWGRVRRLGGRAPERVVARRDPRRHGRSQGSSAASQRSRVDSEWCSAPRRRAGGFWLPTASSAPRTERRPGSCSSSTGGLAAGSMETDRPNSGPSERRSPASE